MEREALKDRGVVHKLEEKHEFLLNNLPFYRKITLTLIPPLQCSLGFLQGAEQPSKGKVDEGSDSASNIKNSRKGPEVPGASALSSESDDLDVALALGGENVLNSFLGMLTTALAYASVDSLLHFKNIFHEKLRKGLDDKDQRHKLVGYSLYESSSESDSELEEPELDDPKLPSIPLEDELQTSEFHTTENVSIKNKIDIERILTQRSDGTFPTASDASDVPRAGEMRLSSTNNTFQSIEDPVRTFAELLQPETFYVAPPKERTVLQNSFMRNIDLASAGDRVLIQYIEAEYKKEDANSREFLQWLTGEKLQDAFELSDDDYYYALFSAWLIKDVLLQGHVYVTRDALCFYSLLPTETPEVETNNPDLTLFSGTLGFKLGHYGDSYFASVYTHRFWGVLKPQSLCIYSSPTEQYFPVKVIDLNDAIYCEIVTAAPSSAASHPELPSLLLPLTTSNSETLFSQLASESSSFTDETLANEDVQSGVWFKIICKDKTYRFHTGNIYSARHWYNGITKVIFQLHNSNSQREVVFKIPMSEVLDFKKNYILTGELDEEDYDNETPVSFTFKYASPLPSTSRLDRIKRRSNISQSQPTPHDYVNLLFFIGGVDFEKLINLRFEDKVGGDQELSLNTRIRLKAKKMLDSDALSLRSKTNSSFISTLHPEISSGVSLADRIAKANDQIVQICNLERLSYEFEIGSALGTNDKKKTMARLLNIIRPTGSLSPPVGNSLASIDTSLWDEQLDKIFENWADGQALQFPKPFSIQTLRNLRLTMVTKQRSPDEVARNLASSPMLEELKKSHQAKLRKKNGRYSVSSLDDKASLDNMSSRELYLTDDSSISTYGSRTKKSKFKSFKDSVQTVSTMGGVWSTDPRHYEKFGSEDPYFVTDEHERNTAVANYQKHFSLTSDTHLVSSYYAYLRRTLPVYGKMYLGTDKLCFRSLFPGVSTKMIIPIKEIESCAKTKSLRFGIKVLAQGGDDLTLVFATLKTRDDAYDMVWRRMEKFGMERPRGHLESLVNTSARDDGEAIMLGKIEKLKEDAIALAKKKVRAARLRLLEDRVGAASGIEFPIVVEDSFVEFTEVKPALPYNFTLLTIGSRGDVQPYIALGKGLLAEGHNVTIATHFEFKDWIVKHNIRFREVAGNPAELMSLMVTHGSMSVSFLKEANSKFKGWITELLNSSWKACEGTEILIESPSAMGGIHIAEALGIPYMRAFTMPWTRTRAYPHAFIVPDSKKGGSYNMLTHVMFENIFWRGISSQVNRWRVETLGLPRTNLVKLQQSRIPFLYNVSPAIFPPSVDFPDWVKVTGYWFLNEGLEDYDPPKALVEFIETAKSNNEKIVYIGFGSIVVSDAKKLNNAVVEAVLELGVKCILNRGWSDRLNHLPEEDTNLPPQIYDAGSVPHDWLFSQIDAAVHHGGSGTTGAALHAGLPTIIKPFFGDQFFYASRVEELGVGIALKNLNTKSLTMALNSITMNPKYLRKAQALALAMQTETGVLTAIAAIYSELAYSKSIITTIKQNTEQKTNLDDRSGVQTPNMDEGSFAIVGKGQHGNDTDDDEVSEDDVNSDDDSSQEGDYD